MTDSTNKPTTGFWVISVIALIWNLMGVMAYIGQAYMTDEALSALPEAEQALYENIPAWATAAFAIAVFGGALGSLLMLLKKKMASTIFTISMLGIIVQMIYNLFMSKATEVYGPGGMVMPIMVIIIGAFLVWYSKKATSNGWLS
ncbi:hypothetical protein [Urechidicola vernalis]|uniref:Sugar transporter n=1 Tax=Urechidicola vernalis TaxID=3075600 RepID=A0ABU2Y154_9FLAO|nr:hypothetical protein [Urechidicola sp. P050]MDT0551917.1 hypothetical protein [Urechidicola sp. P050]